MENVLVPVDGSEVSLRAVQYAIDHVKAGLQWGLIVVNVQPPVLSGEVKLFVSQSLIDIYHREEGEKALAQAKAMLNEANVVYEVHIKVGEIAKTIVHLAQEKHCQSIVMGGRGLGSVAGMLLGSVTTKVLHLASVPVTIVK